ncbi:MAG: HAD-IA family hydrolase [Gemmataceae bacterium]
MKTIFFDFGNVIGYFDHMRAINQMAPYTPIPPVALEKLLYGGPEEDAYEAGRISTKEYVDFALRAGQIDLPPEQFLYYFADIFTKNPDVCDLIPRLAKRYRLVLASNTNDAHYQRYTAMFEHELSFFSARCPSHEIGFRKPRPEYYHATHRAAQAEPSECLFVDDLPRNTIAAAESVGWNVLVYRPGDSIVEKLSAIGVHVDG